MRVILSHSSWRAISHRLPELHVERMAEHRVAAGAKAHSYELPAIAWAQIAEMLTAESYGPRGGKQRELPSSLYTAISRITAAVAMRRHHPAMVGKAVRGAQIEHIPVWQLEGGAFTPFPPRRHGVYADGSDEQWGGRFVVLAPSVQHINGHPITEWAINAEPPGGWLFREESHLEFITARPPGGSPAARVDPPG